MKTDSIITWPQDSVAVLNRFATELVTKLKHTKQPRHISRKVPKQDSIINWTQDSVAVLKRLATEPVTKLKHTYN